MYSSRPILVLGRGFVGQKLTKNLYPAVSRKVELSDADELARVIGNVQPRAVINCAGKTGTPNIDWCETHQSETWRANAIGPIVLRKVCEDFGIFLIHVSSGCLFDGYSSTASGWHENARPKASSFYTRSKLHAEQGLLGSSSAIIRIRLPIDSTPHPRNLLTKLLSFKFVTTAINSVTVLDDLVESVKAVLDSRCRGVFHCVSPQPVALSEIRDRMAAARVGDREFQSVPTTQLSALGLVHAPRTDTVLSNTRLRKLGVDMTPTDHAIGGLVQAFAVRHTKQPIC